MKVSNLAGKAMMRHYSRSKGFTLIELMIALLLGLLLSAGIISVFVEGKRNFVQDDEVSRVQENGRYSLRLLSRELGMAGFFGGVPNSSLVTGGSVTTDCGPSGDDWLLEGEAPLEVIDSSDNSTDTYYSCFADGDIVAGTDLVTIKRASDFPVIENGEWQSGLTSLVSTRYYLHNKNRGLGAVELHQGSGYTDIGAIATANNGSDMWEYYASIFYIGTDDGVPSLCKRELVSTGTGISTQRCLVRGIENLQFELGVDIDADGYADQFVSDDTDPPVGSGANADQIVSVRVHVLARSINEIHNFPAESRSYRLGGGTTVTTPVDQFYRLALSSTVVIRNPTSLVAE
ncbi:MAG TPA: prepilin-type N-terminal cleavage/methylation domain-containing protein [Porticoccus sp.]|nr:prepilin-type N-terminal cleavage/methylation domain-containing protein [Porticoccus sp.]